MMTLYTLPDARPGTLFGPDLPQKSTASNHFAEPALFYDPPYRDEAEDTLAWSLVRFLDEACGLQHRPAMPADVRPVDFVIEKDGRRIGLDVVGDEETDPERDALVFTSGMVDVLYQIRTTDIEHHLHDALFMLAWWEPSLFDGEGLVALADLASESARKACKEPTGDVLHARYVEESVVDGELIAWPAEQVLDVERKGLEHVMPYTDAALHRFQRSLATLSRRFGHCA